MTDAARGQQGHQSHENGHSPRRAIGTRPRPDVRATSGRASSRVPADPIDGDGQARRIVTARVRIEDRLGYIGPQAPQIVAPRWQRRLVIERPADLAAFARDLAGRRVVALDAEFAQPHRRMHAEVPHWLAVLQLVFDDDYRAAYVIDALRLADLSPLEPIFANPQILKVFHGIGADARVLATRNLVARNALDVEAVSRSVFGQQESGLQHMLQRIANERLDKSFQRSDWSRRPLTAPMVAYAARDAEMTYVLYNWLVMHYPAMVALHHTPAEEPAPNVAAWIAPYLEGSRPRPAAVAVTEAGISDDLAAQERDLRAALIAVRHPPQRARVMRLISDLDRRALAEDLCHFLTAPAAEERASAARALGRLGDRSAITTLRSLLEDSVWDVRQAARVALEHIEHGPRRTPPLRPTRTAPGGQNARGTGALRWSSEGDGDKEAVGAAEWQRQLRQRFPPRSE
jgi:hypothetical protein